MKNCYQCGQAWEETRSPGRGEYCPNCGAVWRCCKNCRFFDKASYTHCTLPDIEPVADPEKPNFCEQFVFAERLSTPEKPPRFENAKEKWRKLFKDD